MHTSKESESVNFAVQNVISAAQSLPCRDASKLLHGFLLIAGGDQFPEIRALYQTLNSCEQQLDLIAQKTKGEDVR